METDEFDASVVASVFASEVSAAGVAHQGL